jgi:SAM-dependent methyltransferase
VCGTKLYGVKGNNMNVDYKDTFKYFHSLHPDIVQGTVLDYGSNSGTFLKSAGSQFIEKNYTGLDVDKSAIEFGQREFSQARFVHYDTFNHMYNFSNTSTCSIPITDRFDTVISYSVFTHTTEADMLTRIDELYGLLNVGGKLLFTYLNPQSAIAVNYFSKKRTQIFGHCDNLETSTMLYLVDADVKPYPETGKMLATFYNTEYLKSILAKYQPTAYTCPANCVNCIQDCIVINK